MLKGFLLPKIFCDRFGPMTYANLHLTKEKVVHLLIKSKQDRFTTYFKFCGTGSLFEELEWEAVGSNSL